MAEAPQSDLAQPLEAATIERELPARVTCDARLRLVKKMVAAHRAARGAFQSADDAAGAAFGAAAPSAR
jgi:hypothetical protein